MSLIASLQIKPKKDSTGKYVWRRFWKGKRLWCDSKQKKGLYRSSRPKGSLKKMLWKISQHPQESICTGISFLVFSCELCEICKKTFFAEQHWTSASAYSSINPAGTQRPEDVPLWSYFGRDAPDHNRTKIGRIRFLTYCGSAMSGMHLASGNIEKFP